MDNRRRPLRMVKGCPPPIVSIVGRSNSGKTTFVVKLIAELTERGFRVGTIKHDVHGFEMDRPGKDSWRHKQAGALTTIISSPDKIGMVREVDHDHQPEELLPLLSMMDIVITEGYKRSRIPKLEVFRSDIHSAPFCKQDETLLGMITDAPVDLAVPRFSPDDVEAVADFLIAHFALPQNDPASRTHIG